MDSRSDTASTDVLISIYQEYAEAILSGEKIIEFRKSQFPETVSRVFLYSTSPIKKVIGYFEVETVLRRSPRALWNQYGKYGLIGYEDFLKYYAGAEEACGILVKKVTRYSRPIDLSEFDPRISVPQSYCYLKSDTLQNLKKRRLLAS